VPSLSLFLRIIFAFWGAEENGQVGSNYYVNSLMTTGGASNVAGEFVLVASPLFPVFIKPLPFVFQLTLMWP